MFKYLGAVVMALMLSACGDHAGSRDSLAGTWGVKDGDTVKPLLKVEKSGDRYTVSDYKNGNWEPVQEQIKPMTPGDLAKITGNKEADSVVGIQTNAFAFFHTPVGWSVPGFTTQTGYVIFVPIRLVDLQRIS
ncbi:MULTISPECIES: hypothetical protein [Pandoraea]|uniref:Lipoprotein n=2 Tax=Pandoraea TaxID=93217 RepID=A0A5E4XLY2_9BURK|nr:MULTISPECIES: hypothetical protein [Pandoraea]VVE14410.1 hypothetical protein PCE31107_02813 [Pandoraea cepalis]VVE37306.1 hypothetical protein PTE31013_03997 [Pandoraea terrigena]